MGDLVSIIVPVYNEEIYLKKCVSSIVNQNYQNIEIILVDDGSTNNAVKQCDELSDANQKIKVIHKKNEGLSSARVTGFAMASGKWIMFVDDDDIIAPYAVQKLMEAISDEELDIVSGLRFDMECPEKFEWDYTKSPTCWIESGITVCKKIATDKQKTIITPLWGKIYNRKLLEKFNITQFKDICPTIYFEDVLITPLIYCVARKICIVKQILYLHRELKTSISRSGKMSLFYYEQTDSGQILLEFYKENDMKEMYGYELDLYMRTILRNYCLINEGNLNSEEIQKNKYKIRKCYKKYLKDYLKYASCSVGRKLIFFCYLFMPRLWGICIRKIYYHK